MVGEMVMCEPSLDAGVMGVSDMDIGDIIGASLRKSSSVIGSVFTLYGSMRLCASGPEKKPGGEEYPALEGGEDGCALDRLELAADSAAGSDGS